MSKPPTRLGEGYDLDPFSEKPVPIVAWSNGIDGNQSTLSQILKICPQGAFVAFVDGAGYVFHVQDTKSSRLCKQLPLLRPQADTANLCSNSFPRAAGPMFRLPFPIRWFLLWIASSLWRRYRTNETEI